MSQIDSSVSRVPKSEFVAGRLCLAFCNTVALPNAADRLADPSGLSAWAFRAGHPLAAPPDAPDFHEFLALRQALREIFERLADALPPPQPALDALASMAASPQLVWDAKAHRAIPVAAGDTLAQLRHLLIADAVDLLTGDALDRVKRCPAHDCRWFFFDTSRNATRRWCAMADCGVKDKVQRYRDRNAAF